MQDECCPLSLTQPLLSFLISHYMTTPPIRAEQLNDQVERYVDLNNMQIALSRFMNQPTPYYSFEDDTPEIQAVLEKHCSGRFTRNAGTAWVPGQPMHLDHLLEAIMNILESK